MDIAMLIVKYPTTKDDLLKQHASVFEGLGEFSGEHFIHIDPIVTPVIHGCRKVPLAVMDRLMDTLDDLLKADVIEQVIEPTTWVNSFVITGKKDKKKLQTVQTIYFPFSTPSVDPCEHYTSLDEPWRATNYSVHNYNNYNYDKCVRNVNGWYRLFLNGQNAQMSESCVAQDMCGTYFPLWLNGAHPKLEDGVLREIPVLSSTVLKMNGVERYFFETCESSTGSISISRCQLFEAGFSADGLHLNDPSCRGVIQNGRVEFSFDNNGHTCGTNLMANGTHIIYENFILGAPGLSEGLISRERILQISFSCVYPQTQTLSMIEINPLESVVHKHLPAGEGMYQVRMIPYEDVGFSQPFNGSVNAKLNQKIFVEVRVDGVDSRQLVTVIDTCWATPVNDPDYSLRWDLITGECPNPHDNTVKLLQNGVTTSSRFSFRMFVFNSNSTKVYLHCAVHLCLLANNSCSADCVSGYHQRVGRSLDFYDSSSISMGPFVWSDGNAENWAPELVRVSGAPGLTGCLMILLVSLLSACIIF
ncbi:pancreatic secretory granule membrane major glycoprotein GP2-like [Misgurnus anguillicaudatus]|uniref:pancreatic secretory granule membrane major glycoprotein GP2-like n=1 Tax=Misgurnus anguillicaudatus TaxID=75329 RepID=UPI003CCF8DA5